MTRRWNGVLARVGIPTGDGRILVPGGGSSRSLPLPLAYQKVSEDGHGGSVVVGRIESLSFSDGMVSGTGSLLESAEYDYGGVVEALEAGVIGPSVDLDDIEYTQDEAGNLVITQWRIAGATLVAIPAFEGVNVTLDPVPVVAKDVMEEAEVSALWASAVPAPLPPRDWFTKPDLDRLTPLTVSDTGRVFGHVAGWETCHVGLPGCVTAPWSPSGYAYFHVGSQATQEGDTLAVGTLVAGPRHADPQLAFQAAQQHYDDPSAMAARVVAGEDEYGIWVAGWMPPEVTEEARKTFMSSPVSGDWRRIGGHLELVAVCSVNTPGFPVPRARVAFGLTREGVEAQRTLIASSGLTPTSEANQDRRESVEGTEGTVSSLRARARWAWANTGREG